MWLLKGRKRKRQRGVFLPLLGTLAKRLLESAVRTVGSKLLEKLYKKSLDFGGRKGPRKTYRWRRKRISYAYK